MNPVASNRPDEGGDQLAPALPDPFRIHTGNRQLAEEVPAVWMVHEPGHELDPRGDNCLSWIAYVVAKR